MIDKILDTLSQKMDLSDKRKNKIRNFRKTRLRLINIMISSGKIGALKLKFITHFLTFLGCGKIKNAPGTLASFVTVLLWLLVTTSFAKIQLPALYENLFWFTLIIILTFYAIIFIPIYARNFAEEDHPSIVIDEVVGQLLALCLTYPLVRQYYHEESWMLTKIVMFAHMFLCFLLFRTLDIAKPWIIGSIDRNIKNAFGVMLDDIVAGVVTALLNITLFIFYKNSILQLHGY